MGLFDLIAAVEADEKVLTVFDPDPGVVDALREHFADRNLAIRATETAADPANYAVLSRGEEFLTAIDVADVLAGPTGVSSALARETYDPVLDELDETMFTSYDTARMEAASTEIEDRAWRFGRGELHAGFQTGEKFAPQHDTYERLAGRDGLDVHVYGAPAGFDSLDISGPTLHLSTATEITDTWFVAYDGGGTDDAKCALLAEERSEGSFYGFWAYDPETVTDLLSYLEDTYAVTGTASDGGRVG
jgi:hypothetical protein